MIRRFSPLTMASVILAVWPLVSASAAAVCEDRPAATGS